MDFLAFLNGRLDFIQRFYDQAAAAFREIKRKIDAGEEPFFPRHPPADQGEPEYLTEWIDADDSLRVLGQCSLNLVAKAIQDYLREFITREVGKSRLAKLKGQGWFEKYENFLVDALGFRWDRSPVDRGLIEQLNLSRNDGTHDPVIETTWPKQNEAHFRKYPTSFFADEMEQAALAPEAGSTPDFPSSIHVTSEKLVAAISSARAFCTFVETHRQTY
jgi:hypothetical protein